MPSASPTTLPTTPTPPQASILSRPADSTPNTPDRRACAPCMTDGCGDPTAWGSPFCHSETVGGVGWEEREGRHRLIKRPSACHANLTSSNCSKPCLRLTGTPHPRGENGKMEACACVWRRGPVGAGAGTNRAGVPPTPRKSRGASERACKRRAKAEHTRTTICT